MLSAATSASLVDLLGRTTPAGDPQASRRHRQALPLLAKGMVATASTQLFRLSQPALPVLAFTTPSSAAWRRRGPDRGSQLHRRLPRKQPRQLPQGRGQGGQWTRRYALDARNGQWQPDETTAAVAEYLLLYSRTATIADNQQPPPSEVSDFTTTTWRLRALRTSARRATGADRKRSQRCALAAGPVPRHGGPRLSALGIADGGADPRTCRRRCGPCPDPATRRGWGQLDDATATLRTGPPRRLHLVGEPTAIRLSTRRTFLLKTSSPTVLGSSAPAAGVPDVLRERLPHGKDQFSRWRRAAGRRRLGVDLSFREDGEEGP